MKGKSYPVQFMHFRDNKDRPAGGKGKVPKSSKENDGKKLASTQRKRQLEWRRRRMWVNCAIKQTYLRYLLRQRLLRLATYYEVNGNVLKLRQGCL